MINQFNKYVHATNSRTADEKDEKDEEAGKKILKEFLERSGDMVMRTMDEDERGTLCLSVKVNEETGVSECYMAFMNATPAHLMGMIIAISQMILRYRLAPDVVEHTNDCHSCIDMAVAASLIEALAIGIDPREMGVKIETIANYLAGDRVRAKLEYNEFMEKLGNNESAQASDDALHDKHDKHDDHGTTKIKKPTHNIPHKFKN